MSDSIDKSYLEQLNAAQRAAVEYNDGPALVLAGAGSGKTRVLVYKLLHLIHSGYHPSRLMALTFTNKAAREMRARIERLVGHSARSIQMGTFHSVFSRILRQHAELLGYTSDFSIYNANDSKNKIKSIIKLLALDEKVYKPGLIQSRISNAKNRLQDPSAYRANAEQSKLDTKANIPRTGEIYNLYTVDLRLANAMDFDDLLVQINRLFKEHPEVLASWQERIDYLLIDEYQDTNFAQYMIARQLMQRKGKIFVVGDDAQSIYSFRGANIENMFSFERTFQGARRFLLEQNYRSSQTIVEAAKHLIARNKNQLPKAVFSLGEIGDPIELYEAVNAEAEASWVGRTIETIRIKQRVDYDHFAVLYRTNQQSRVMEQRLRSMGIPFRIWGGRSFFDHKEVMDVIAYFRLMVNPSDDEALLRIINYPKRGIGDTTILKLRQKALEHHVSISTVLLDPLLYGVEANKGTLSKLNAFVDLLVGMREQTNEEQDFYKLCNWLINTSGIPAELRLDTSPEGKTRLDNLQELLGSIDEYVRNMQEEGEVPNMRAYLSEVALLTDQDSNEEEEQARVTLMTIHASKGLEFPHVFIVGLEEQLFPSPMSSSTLSELEEERRLLYVAITRAERSCHIGYARERFRNGRSEFTHPSRFLRELPRELLRESAGARDALDLDYYRQEQGRLPQSGASLPNHFSPRNFMPTGSSKRVHLERRAGGDEFVPEPQYQTVGELRIGSRVRHSKFGDGEVTTLEGTGDNIKAIVHFDSGDTRKLLLRFAHLECLD